MPTQTVPVYYDRFENADYVLGYDETVIGAVRVYGLEAALSEAQKTSGRIDVPDVTLAPADADTKAWLRAWGNAMLTDHKKRDLVIRDNRRDRWIAVKGTFIHEGWVDGDSHSLSVDRVELGERPEWWVS